MSESIPLHAYDLIDELAERYPEVIYDPRMDREEFLLRQGERRLVLSLIRRRQLDDETQHVHG
ncbi:hypothetical protein [Luteibacter sp. 9135]|uniref:hypothetical protein n=1 Tax=Luteibacter sp. 9135 TaxID=1500893 RepID=UPI000562E88F|nr:hypothetical protein [Luteibacter sp. 9135]